MFLTLQNVYNRSSTAVVDKVGKETLKKTVHYQNEYIADKLRMYFV